jgi:ATP-dependent 26S proteasome regulatory subunit
MLELLNQLDGFASDDRVKVLAATNRVDVLDPALLRSGRLDRKIEFPLPNEEARAQILRIHSRKMTVDEGVNWQELARSTDEFGGAQLKAVCVEAGMIALRSGQHKISHEHYVDAIAEVQVRFYSEANSSNSTDTSIGQEEGHGQLLRIRRLCVVWVAWLWWLHTCYPLLVCNINMK